MQGAQSAPCNPMELFIFLYGDQATKYLFGLQCYSKSKVNPRWGMKSKIGHAVARHIKPKTKNA